jgi:glycosyltransferase involved in cell wall biosynthesis
MKILFVMPSFYPVESSTANCVWSIIKELQKEGHIIHVLTQRYNGTSSFQKYKNISIYRINENTNLKLNALAQITKEMLVSLNRFSKTEGKQPDTYIFFKYITKLYSDNLYDNIIACEAFYIAEAVYWAHIKNKNLLFIIYQTNPYYSNYFYPSEYRKLREIKEFYTYKKSCGVITTDLIYEDIKKSKILSKLKNKIKPCMLPLIKEPSLIEVEDDILLDSNYINCVFIGNLYKKIREPNFAIRIFQLLKRQDIRIIFIGPNIIKTCGKYTKFLGKRIVLYDKVSLQAAINVMNRADFLLNIGNTISNMLPGKILDYISTGKPIINLYSIDNCPSLVILKHYENCINIKQSKANITEKTNQILDFIENNKDTRVHYNDIEVKYKEYTPENVTKQFTKLLKEMKS